MAAIDPDAVRGGASFLGSVCAFGALVLGVQKWRERRVEKREELRREVEKRFQLLATKEQLDKHAREDERRNRAIVNELDSLATREQVERNRAESEERSSDVRGDIANLYRLHELQAEELKALTKTMNDNHIETLRAIAGISS